MRKMYEIVKLACLVAVCLAGIYFYTEQNAKYEQLAEDFEARHRTFKSMVYAECEAIRQNMVRDKLVDYRLKFIEKNIDLNYLEPFDYHTKEGATAYALMDMVHYPYQELVDEECVSNPYHQMTYNQFEAHINRTLQFMREYRHDVPIDWTKSEE